MHQKFNIKKQDVFQRPLITWGGDLQEALYAAVYLEEAAKTYVLAKAMGVQIPALPPELIAQEKAGWETYGQ